jgi:uncharacterized membrane protein YfhO
MHVSASNVFFSFGVVLGILYFMLFWKTVRDMTPAERDRYNSAGNGYTAVIPALLIFGFMFTSSFEIRVLLILCIAADFAISSYIQYQKLKKLSFEQRFLRKQVLQMCLSAAGVATVLLSFFAEN